MRAIRLTIAMALGLCPAGLLNAHPGAVVAAAQDAPGPTFKLEKITGSAYCLYGKGGNVGFLVTGGGVVVVDDQYQDIAQGIVDQIRAVTDEPIRYLVNTHYHADHTGGNPVFIKLATIVAHDTVRPRLLEFPLVVQRVFPGKVQALEAEMAAIKDTSDPYREALGKDVGIMKFFIDNARGWSLDTAAPPGLTYDGQMNIWLDGHQIKIVHVGPGHTDGDSMVYFPGEKVLHMGDLFFNGMVPFIDVEGGGSGLGYLRSIDWVLEHMPPDTRLIPGHGPVTDMATLRHHRDFLADLKVEVGKAVRRGETRAQAARSVKLDRYPDIKPAFRTLANDVLVFYDEMRSKK